MFTRNLGLELRRGKIVVDQFLQVQGCENVWCIGDAALIPMPIGNGDEMGSPSPGLPCAIAFQRNKL